MVELRDCEVTNKKIDEKTVELTSKRATGGEWVGRFIADVRHHKLYAIPQDIDHPDFVALLTGRSVRDLKNAPLDFNYFVGMSVVVVDNVITRLLIGISGHEFVMVHALKKLSMGLKRVAYHTVDQLKRAEQMAYSYVLGGAILLSPDHKVQVVREI